METTTYTYERILDPTAQEDWPELYRAVVERWNNHPEEAQSSLERIRRHNTNVNERMDELNDTARKYARIAQAVAQQLRNANTDLGNIISRSAEDTTPVGMDSDIARRWLAHVFEFAIRVGNSAESHKLAIELNYKHDGVEDIWDTVARRLRQPDGTYPAAEHWAIAHANAQVNNHTKEHPAHPMLADFWQEVWRVAKIDAEFCNVWDEHAENLGIPQPEMPTKSGTVDVEATVILTLSVEEIPYDENGWENIDREDIERELQSGDGYVSHWEIQETDLSPNA